jgi:hypothetical protein
LQFRFEDGNQVMRQGQDLAQFIASQGKDGRLYSPSYSVPQLAASENHLELTEGINPLHTYGYAKYMSGATGVDYTAYGVTIPPFATGNPATDNQGSLPDLALLGKLNVRYIVAEYNIPIDGLKKLGQVGSSVIYENELFQNRAVINKNNSKQPINLLKDDVKSLKMTANGPGKIILSEMYYPGWKVMVDGKEEKMLLYDSIFQSVDIGAGFHTIEFVFSPDLIIIGFLISLFFICVNWVVRFAKS